VSLVEAQLLAQVTLGLGKASRHQAVRSGVLASLK
jgi:hypothetical protein